MACAVWCTQAAEVKYKGTIKGRKGEWLGIRLEQPIGDCDGTVGGERYFTCEDTQGLFIRWESGRLVAAPERAVLPGPVLEHMRMLFETCDASQTGGLDVNELGQAMQLLGQEQTDAEAIFERIVSDADRVSARKGAIEFDEFTRIMEEQWVGVDLDAVVQSIQEEDAKELRRQEEARRAALTQDLKLDVIGVDLDLKYFGSGTNAGLFVVYSCLALAVTAQIYLHAPEDTLTVFMVAVLGGSAALFGIGGVAIKTQNWPLVKMYAVLLFFAAGMQVAVCIAFNAGLLQMSTSVVAAVMDRECGTCIGAGRCATVSSSVLAAQASDDGHEQPWYCCCAHNECRGEELDLVVLAQATCEDACALANLAGSNTDSRGSCLAQGGGAAGSLGSGCVYVAATDAVCEQGDPGLLSGSCPAMAGLNTSAARAACLGAAGCEYTPGIRRRCTQADADVRCAGNEHSESACASAGVCVYTPVEYGRRAGLSVEQEAAKQMCQGREEYLGFARLRAYPKLSVLGEDRCFDRDDDPNDAGGYAGKLSR